MQKLRLPIPDDDAIAHSTRLMNYIEQQISLQGALPFSRYMQLALYAAGQGYYVSGNRKFGAGGDFVTAPEISDLFSRTLAHFYLTSCLHQDTVLELGAGTGRMACDFLQECERQQKLPQQYQILELSPELRQRQYDYFAIHAPHLLSRIAWLTQLPDVPVDGLIVANEVMDALPVDCFYLSEDTYHERRVHCRDGRLCWENASPSPQLAAAIEKIIADYQIKPSYCSEISLQLPAWIASLGACLREGTMLLLDYGFLGAEYYHPQRNQGTLMCHYRHHSHTDPFWYPGLQDITAHVDFSSVIRAGELAGLSVRSYQTQADFLLEHHIHDYAQAQMQDPLSTLKVSQQLQTLLFPSEMGELFKVIVFDKLLAR